MPPVESPLEPEEGAPVLVAEAVPMVDDEVVEDEEEPELEDVEVDVT